ncbi:hypothetical protein C8R44DRAFT_753196 [Mycena epipterygia]|nr:hypothetical protein C8R44DRAFT_753196 [Mycena epipterygia]
MPQLNFFDHNELSICWLGNRVLGVNVLFYLVHDSRGCGPDKPEPSAGRTSPPTSPRPSVLKQIVEDDAMRKRWAKDTEKVGHTTCPECKRLLQYGPGGVVNLHKTHLGTQVRRVAQIAYSAALFSKESANPHSLLCLRLGYYAPKSGRDHWQVFYPAGSDSAGIYYQSPESNIYALLKDLPLMRFWVGADDLLPDKDPKHVFKRLRNRHLRKGGTDVMGVHVSPPIIRSFSIGRSFYSAYPRTLQPRGQTGRQIGFRFSKGHLVVAATF